MHLAVVTLLTAVIKACSCKRFASFQNDRSIDTCSNVAFPPCITSYGQPGNICHNSPERCIPRQNWCSFHYSTLSSVNCENSENLLISSCFQAQFSLSMNGTQKNRYLYVKAKTDWHIAEQFCQANGYNLVSITSQTELDKIIELLTKFGNSRWSWGEGTVWFQDPLGQLCWDNFAELHFWLGLFYNMQNGTWEYTDKSKVNWNIKSPFTRYNGRRDTLSYMESLKQDTLRRPSKVARAKFWRGEFWRMVFDGGLVSLDDSPFTGYADILCKRNPLQKVQKWSKSSTYADSRQITGYHCPKGHKVLIGPEYKSSSFLNHKNDCSLGEDESGVRPPAPSLRVATDDGIRQFAFYPIKSYPSSIRAFCSSLGWKLPSPISISEVKLLQELPRLYTKQPSTQDFWVHIKNWTSDKTPVLIWNHDYLSPLGKNSTGHQSHTYILSNGKVIKTKNPPKTYVICQIGSNSAQNFVRYFLLQVSFLLTIVLVS